jgi:hypothetical protein
VFPGVLSFVREEGEEMVGNKDLYLLWQDKKEFVLMMSSSHAEG